MTAYDFVGLVSGAAGLGLALSGLVLALLGALRLLLVPGGRRRIGRGLALGGAVLLACGVALFLAADLLPAPALRRAVDRNAIPLSGLALLLAVGAGLRGGRRRAGPGQGAAAGTRRNDGAGAPAADAPPVAPARPPP